MPKLNTIYRVERTIQRLPMPEALRYRLMFGTLRVLGYDWCGACCTTGRIGTACTDCGTRVGAR
jgi:hypothetical protein